MIKETLQLPFSDARKFLIGSALGIVPLLNIFGFFVVYGYVMELARGAFQGELRLPEWSNFRALFVDGLLGTLIGLIWFIPGIILGLLLFGWSFAQVLTQSIPLTYGGVLFILVLTAGSYIAPASIMNFVKRDTFESAIDIRFLFPKIFTKQYVMTWILTTILMILINIILGSLSAILIQYLGVGSSALTIIALAILRGIPLGIAIFIQTTIMFAFFGQTWAIITKKEEKNGINRRSS